MAILSSLIGGAVGKAIVSTMFDRVGGVFESYQKREMTREAAEAAFADALIGAAGEVEETHAKALTSTFASFMDAAKTNPLMVRIWAAVILSQLAVLLWHQLGIPAFTAVTGSPYPSSGASADWAYLLIAALMGMGPLVLRSGPGAANPMERFKGMLRR